MLRPSPNHGTQRLPNDDDDEWVFWGASGFSDSLAPRASGCHSPMSRPGMLVVQD